MAVDNQFKETVDALFKGMNGVVSSRLSCIINKVIDNLTGKDIYGKRNTGKAAGF